VLAELPPDRPVYPGSLRAARKTHTPCSDCFMFIRQSHRKK
jgi:hypothetical protein